MARLALSRAQIAELADRLLAEQGGKCAIRGCTRKPGTRRFHVDHDHATGQVRGLVCHWHNRIMPKDSAEALALADYLAIAESRATHRLVYCAVCHKTHSVMARDTPCAPGAWLDPEPIA